MSGLKTEYEVEKIFINQLNNEQGYSYIDMAKKRKKNMMCSLTTLQTN